RSRPRRPRVRARRVRAISALARTSPSRSNHATRRVPLDVESGLDEVADGDLVILPFDAQLAHLTGLGPRADLDELLPIDDLGPDEPALEVGVDDAGAPGRLPPGPERPGPGLLLAGGEERAQAEQVIGGPHEPGQ